MSLIDATDDHHRGQDLQIADVAGIASKERLDRVWLVGFDNDIDPGTGDVNPWQCVDDLVDLHDHNCVVEGGGLNNHRGIFGVRSCEQIAFVICLFCADQYYVRDKVYEQTRIQFNVGMNGADFKNTVFEKLRNPQALWTGKC